MGQKVKVGVCMEFRAARMSMLRVLASAEHFDVVCVAPRQDLFVPLAMQLYPDMIIVDDAAAGGNVEELGRYIAQGRRIIPVLVTSRGNDAAGPDVSIINVKLLHRSDSSARGEVEMALFAAATPIMTSKRTLLADELTAKAEQLRAMAVAGDVRQEVMRIGSWPLDLVLVVDDGSNLTLLAKVLGKVSDLPVPIVVAFESGHGDGYVELSNVAPKLVHRLTAPISVREMRGVYVVPPDRQVQLYNDMLHVAPGARDSNTLLASMGWAKSGGLTISMSCADPGRAEVLEGVAKNGGIVGVLDTPYCQHPEATVATRETEVPPQLLAPGEIEWLLQYALPRKG